MQSNQYLKGEFYKVFKEELFQKIEEKHFQTNSEPSITKISKPEKE